MEDLKQQIAEAASKVVGATIEPDWIELANPKAGSHLALPCFRLASELGKSPADIASDIAGELSLDEIAKVEAAGPYVNIWLSGSFLAEQVSAIRTSQLKDAEPNNQKVIVEFLSPNLAKPLSIGHLRNALQGRAMTLMFKNAGYAVVTDSHVGDWGTVFGMWVVGFMRFSSDEQLARDGNQELGRVYVEVRQALKQEEEEGREDLATEIQEWLIKLEEGDEEAWDYHKRFSDISLRDVAEQMAELDITFDYQLGESFFVERGKEIVEELLESGVAEQSDDGSVIVPLDSQGIDTPMLIQKSNGAALYATSDMATMEYREKTWDPDLVMYVVGLEQQHHFRQLFAANQLAHWTDAELVHHWYGLIEELDEHGNRRKMSSRSKAIFASDFLDMANDKAREIAPDDLNDEDVKRIAHGAITFREFSASHKMNTLFDWESMFNLSGFSGPYVQYAAVRINSVLSKAESDYEFDPSYDWAQHADMLWLLSKFPGVISDAQAEYEYHKLAEYAYELAKAWNKFYEDVQILSSEGDDLSARLWLAATIGAVLERTLALLGIKIPSRM